MLNDSTQDPKKQALIRPTPFEKENSLNILAGSLFQETKDFEELNSNLHLFKTKGFGNSNFPNYNSANLGFLGGYGNSMFGQFDKGDATPNNFDMNSNKKDISFSKKPLEFEFSNNNTAPNFANLANNGIVGLDNPLFINNLNNNHLMVEDPHFGENDKAYKNFFSPNMIPGAMSQNKMNLSLDSSLYFFANKENSKKLLPMIGNLEEEPRYVNEKQYNRMMIRRIKRAKEMASKMRHHQAQAERNTKKRYKYESRHQHATKRARDSNGKFLKTSPRGGKISRREREGTAEQHRGSIGSSAEKGEERDENKENQKDPQS